MVGRVGAPHRVTQKDAIDRFQQKFERIGTCPPSLPPSSPSLPPSFHSSLSSLLHMTA